MAEPIISVSGLRGVIGSELSPATVVRYIAAYCTQLPSGPIVISRDGRESGMMLKHAAIATLLAHGKTVLDADVAATPTVGILVRTLSAMGGIQLTASHNPREYNGIKLFNSDGRIINHEAGNAVREAYIKSSADWKPIDAIGQLCMIDAPHEGHLQKILKVVNPYAIQSCKFRVLLDSNHGSGAALGRLLLERLGCEVTVLGEEADGKFEHPPEPIESNLASVAELVREGQFDIGFCQDPDADRLAIIDANGVYIGEEYSSVLCMLNALEQRAKYLEEHPDSKKTPSSLVINCASSSMSQKLAERFGVTLFRTKVGEANVVDGMIEHRALFGGEGSGGPIDPRIGWVRDSFVGMASVLDLMARRKQSIDKIVEELPRFSMIKDKIALQNLNVLQATDAIAKQMDADSVSTLDGLRLDWPNAWLLVRGSNTEPIVRFICEAEDESTAKALVARAKAIVSTLG